jgi:hypothetical protein
LISIIKIIFKEQAFFLSCPFASLAGLLGGSFCALLGAIAQTASKKRLSTFDE